MEKWGWCVLLAFVVQGCVAMETKRGVKDNYFYSTRPQVALKLDPRLEYARKEDKFSIIDQEALFTMDAESYSFVNRFDQTMVLVQLQTLQENSWRPPGSWHIDNLISSKNIVKTGHQYFQADFTYQEKDGTCFLIRKYARLTGASNQTILQIYYIQPIQLDCSCREWSRTALSDPIKKRQLEKFAEKSEAAMEFTDIQTLNLYQE